MKKNDPNTNANPDRSESETLDPIELSKTTQRIISAGLRNPKHPGSVSPIFTIAPDVDTITLLNYASETLASLNVMTTDLANRLDGSHRNVALALQQLAELAEMLINQALNNLDPREPAADIKRPVYH
jgi:hypothetical protein